MGYHRSGFTITGVDCASQARYPFAFIQADALDYVAAHGQEYDAVFASPPCQCYSALKHLTTRQHPDLVGATRDALQATGKPYVIENVVGAPLRWPLLLCGSMFGLQTSCGAQLRRHRLFESNLLLLSPGACQHGARTLGVHGHAYRDEAARWRARTITVTGSTPQQNVERNTIRETFSIAEARVAMGIDWLGMQALSQAIPPAYSAWIGRQIVTALQRQGATS